MPDRDFVRNQFADFVVRGSVVIVRSAAGVRLSEHDGDVMATCRAGSAVIIASPSARFPTTTWVDCTHVESLDEKDPFSKYLGAITRATLRLDGFVSATAGHSGAVCVTKPLVFSGDRLELNVDCSAGGYLNVELQSADGEPLPGYSLIECDRVYHNNIRKVVTWKGQSNLSELAGKPVRMRLVSRDCKLYAFQFPKTSQ